MNQPAFDNEPEIRVFSFAGSFALMLLLVALLLFIRISQSIPQPPPIQFVEVNFGTDAVGSGRIQTYNKASDSPNAEDVKKAEKTPNPKVTTTPRVEKTPVAPVPKVEEVKEKSKTVTEKPIIATKNSDSPVTVPEKAEPKKTKASPAPNPAPPTTAPVKKVETVDPNALYKRSSGGGGANGTVGKAAGTGGNNNGDDAKGVGDKGNPNGKLDAKEFYGSPNGGSSGVAFDVSGWSLASRPNVNDDSDETGKIVFQLTVDDAGNIINVKTKQTTVGASVVEVYRRAVQRLRLRPKSANTPPTSTGTITFIITSK
jgi:periplasmic protein TonB